MVHFGIFGHDFNTGGILDQTTVPKDTGQFTGTSDFISSGESTKQLINISTFLQKPNLQDEAILGGFADASKAINNLFDGLRQQTQVNEQQRAVNNTFSKELDAQLGFKTDKTSGPIDLNNIGGGLFDSIKGNIGTTGLLIGAGLLALLVLKK